MPNATFPAFIKKIGDDIKYGNLQMDGTSQMQFGGTNSILYRDGSGRYILTNTSGETLIASNNQITFSSNTTDRLRIDTSTGNLFPVTGTPSIGLSTNPFGTIYTATLSDGTVTKQVKKIPQNFGRVKQTSGTTSVSVEMASITANAVVVVTPLTDLTISTSHNHIQNEHNHTQNAHNHTQNAHNHIQDAHNHTQNEHAHDLYVLCATSPSIYLILAASYIGGYGPCFSHSNTLYPYSVTIPGSNSETNGGVLSTTATNNTTVATNQATTATNNAVVATNNATVATNQESSPNATYHWVTINPGVGFTINTKSAVGTDVVWSYIVYDST